MVEDIVGIGEGSLHLVQDDTVIRERGVFRGKLQVPAFLLEDARTRIDGRMQHGVEIDVHEVLEVLLVRGGHGIDRLVRECHCVQKRLHRRLEEVDERLLYGELLRAIEDGVLEDMEDAGRILWRRLEADREGLVRIVGCKPEQACSCCLMLHHIGAAGELRDGLGRDDLKSMVDGARSKRRIGLEEIGSLCSLGRIRHGASLHVLRTRAA